MADSSTPIKVMYRSIETIVAMDFYELIMLITLTSSKPVS